MLNGFEINNNNHNNSFVNNFINQSANRYIGYITKNKNEMCYIFDKSDLTETLITFEQYQNMFGPKTGLVCECMESINEYMVDKKNFITTHKINQQLQNDAAYEFKKRMNYTNNDCNLICSSTFGDFLQTYKLNLNNDVIITDQYTDDT